MTGTVLHNGDPVEGATVSFQPKSAGPEDRPARGTTDSSGRFTLKTYINPKTDVDGAIPGEYLVVVTKTESSSMSPEDMAKAGAAGKKMEAPKSLLPTMYANAKKSGLTATVNEDDGNDFKFELND